MQELGEGERSLRSALRAVAEDEAGRGASRVVESRLRAEVRSLARTRRRRSLATLVAAAAVVLIAVAVPSWFTAELRPLSDGLGTGAEQGANGSTLEAATDFFPLIYFNVPMTGGQIVRLEMPEATLAAFGVGAADVPDGARLGTVLADVLVGEDGLARAVRFVRPVTTVTQQELQQ